MEARTQSNNMQQKKIVRRGKKQGEKMEAEPNPTICNSRLNGETGIWSFGER